MARTPQAVTTRIATTITARYYPSSGATDGFYLDGRLSGRREHRAADITLDRETRGSFYAVYAHLAGSSADDAVTAKVHKALDKVHFDLAETGRNIDSEINDLAECAVSVAGRIALHHEGVRQPYFAGIMVKDAELAAVTMGGGCAYLYRADVLYPLTADDSPLEAIDTDGRPVEGIDVYCAGVAGTVRYSNIAQLQMDDCLIVCNKDVIEALGQREILRMLDEAEDQADAAGIIMTAASAKLPGVPLQFMIGFVESVLATEKPGRILSGKPLPGAAALGSLAAKRSRTTPKAKPPEMLTEEDEEIFDEDASLEPEQTGDDGDYGEYEDYDEFVDNRRSGGRGRRIAFYLVIAAICIGCIFAIYNMIWPNGDTGSTTEPAVTTTTSATAEPSESLNSTDPTTDPSQTQPSATSTAASGEMQQYTVKSGDTLWSIAIQFYGEATDDLYQLIRDANDMTSDTVQVGQVLDIPAKP